MDNIFLLITILADAAAAVLMARLLGISDAYYAKKEIERRYFRYFIWSVIGIAVVDAVRETLSPYRVTFDIGGFRDLSKRDAGIVLMGTTVDILNLFLTTVFLFLWLLYVSWRLYPGRDYARRRFRRALLPLLVSGTAAVLALVMILFVSDAGFIPIAAVLVFLIIRVFYFIVSILRIDLYKKQNGYMKFFSIKGFFIPVVAGTLIQDFTPFNVRALGFAVGITCLYASIVLEQRYEDRETGLYNSNYRTYLEKLVRRGRFVPYSAMVFTVRDAGRITELSGILKKQLPKDCEPIRRTDNEVIVLTPVREKAPLFLVTEDVKALTEVETSCILKDRSETPEEFMGRVL